MQYHVWKEPPGEVLECLVCGYTRPLHASGRLPIMNCGKPEGPEQHEKAVNFAKAILHQLPLVGLAIVTADKSKAFREPEEIERIAAICRDCPLFDGEKCQHKNCGCPISADRNAFLSKLAYKSQSCPDGKW